MCLERAQQRSGGPAETQHSGIGGIIQRPAKLYILFSDIQQDMQEASADSGMGDFPCLQEAAEGTEAGEGIEVVSDAV